MKKLVLTAAILAMTGSVALADDAMIAKGEAEFKVCETCHKIDGPNLQRGSKETGPNLYGVVGRKAGADPSFARSSGKTKFGKSLVAAGEKGLVWDAEHFAKFVPDPKGFLKDYLGENASVKMAPQKKADAAAIFAYLEAKAK